MPWIENCAMIDVHKGFHYDPGPNAVLIQIIEKDRTFLTPLYAFKEVHQFQFDDIEDDDPLFYKNGISKADASGIARVLQNALENRSNVIVHCAAGVCRSGAVVRAAVEYGFIDTGKHRIPNLAVYREVRLALGMGWSDNRTKEQTYAALFEDTIPFDPPPLGNSSGPVLEFAPKLLQLPGSD